MNIGNTVKVKTAKQSGFKWTITNHENGQTEGTSHQVFSKRKHAHDMLDKILKCTVMQELRNMAQFGLSTNRTKTLMREMIALIDANQDRIVGTRKPAQSPDKPKQLPAPTRGKR